MIAQLHSSVPFGTELARRALAAASCIARCRHSSGGFDKATFVKTSGTPSIIVTDAVPAPVSETTLPTAPSLRRYSRSLWLASRRPSAPEYDVDWFQSMLKLLLFVAVVCEVQRPVDATTSVPPIADGAKLTLTWSGWVTGLRSGRPSDAAASSRCGASC